MTIKEIESCDRIGNLVRWTVDPRVAPILRGSGFVELSELSYFRVNRKLMGLLANAYDESSCSFIFGGKNLFFGLIDVLYITGLSICGKPIIGVEVDNRETCVKYLGIDLVYQHNNCIKLQDLKDRFMTLPEEVSVDDLHKATRAFCLYVIGSFICPDTSNSYVSPIFLQYLDDVSQIKDYAWEAALWAHLQCSLRKLKKMGHARLYGAGSCLQIFAYLSLRNVAREFNACVRGRDDIPTFPFICSWSHKMGKLTTDGHKKWDFENGLEDDENIIFNSYEVFGDVFLPPHLMSQAILAKTTSAMTLCNNEYAAYFVEKLPDYFGACGDGWDLNYGGKDTRRGFKFDERNKAKNWKEVTPYPVYLERWNSTYAQLLPLEGVADMFDVAEMEVDASGLEVDAAGLDAEVEVDVPDAVDAAGLEVDVDDRTATASTSNTDIGDVVAPNVRQKGQRKGCRLNINPRETPYGNRLRNRETISALKIFDIYDTWNLDESLSKGRFNESTRKVENHSLLIEKGKGFSNENVDKKIVKL